MNKISYLAIVGILLFLNRQARAQHALTSNGAKITISNGGTLDVKGDTYLGSGSVFKNDGSFSSSGKLTTDQTMVAGSLGTITFDGSSTQTVDGTGTFLAKNVVVNNPAGLMLNSPLQVDGNILLTNGIISTSSSSALILTESATVTGPSDISHVNGYVQKQGIGTFSYPVGNGSKIQAIVVELDANNSGFLVKYFTGDAGAAGFGTTGASKIALESYNAQEYWDLKPVSTAAGRVTVSWDETNNGSITTSENINVFKVAHKTSSGWLNEGSLLVSGTVGNGSVTSQTVSSWSPFTLGAISEAALPVTLADFGARLIENHILVQWHTTQESNASHFEVERSSDARNFNLIGKVDAAGTSAALARYSHFDNNLPASSAILYYRLRSVDTDGSYSYSRIISVEISGQNFISSVYPNPVLKTENIVVESNTNADRVTVYNILGTKSAVTTRHLSAGKIEINTSQLANGIYLIRLDAADKTVYHRLIVL
ncbi:MAG TPA: T9SS type A sorting domain-containing protein [Dyadobacter sp.]|jgi:hypothetical protein|nr:T9SS type A sorting domain-containing protein [Dyadobacter sp.]